MHVRFLYGGFSMPCFPPSGYSHQASSRFVYTTITTTTTVSVAFDYLNTDVDTLSEESLSDVVATILAYHVTTEYLPDLV